MDQAPRDGTPSVLATLVGTAGSTYRKPGARMLIVADGRSFGLLSGGCLEADLGLHAQQVLQSGIGRAVEYDMRGPDDILFGIGAGCEGAMRILLEPAGAGSLAATALAAAADSTRAGRAAALVAIHESADLPLGTYHPATLTAPTLIAASTRALHEAGSHAVEFESGAGRTRGFVQFLAPAPHIVICGAGPDAVPVAAAATSLGWRVSVVDHRPAYARAERFAGARVHLASADALPATVALEQCHAAVVMSHHLPADVAYLRALAPLPTPGYVGLLGPPARRLRIAQELGDSALGLRSRLRGPVGIDMGAATPEGIALAIVAEIHAWLAGRPLAPHR